MGVQRGPRRLPPDAARTARQRHPGDACPRGCRCRRGAARGRAPRRHGARRGCRDVAEHDDEDAEAVRT
eukprot:scaffold1618_cov397-Prasinococcus_capsulatus_cf.AAC.26